MESLQLQSWKESFHTVQKKKQTNTVLDEEEKYHCGKFTEHSKSVLLSVEPIEGGYYPQWEVLKKNYQLWS